MNCTVESDAELRNQIVASIHSRIYGKNECHSEVKLLSAERTIRVRGVWTAISRNQVFA